LQAVCFLERFVLLEAVRGGKIMRQKIRKLATVSAIVCATVLGACVEDDEDDIIFGYCMEAYLDCLDECRGSSCYVCESEYNNCENMADVYRFL
jgi:hypothetical protein